MIFKQFFCIEDDDEHPLLNIFFDKDRNMHKILQMSMEDMELLEYQDKDDEGIITKYPLKRQHLSVFQRLKVWFIHLKHQGCHPEHDIAKWKALDRDEYSRFVQGPQCSALMEDKSLFNSFASPTTVRAATPATWLSCPFSGRFPWPLSRTRLDSDRP